MHRRFHRRSGALVGAALALGLAAATPAVAASPIPANDETSIGAPPPVPTVQDPDVGVDLQVLAPCATQTELDALRDSLADRGPGAARRDVRVSCRDGRTRIGIFPGVLPVSPQLSSARDAGLARIDLARNARSAIRVNGRVTDLLESQTASALLDQETSSLKFKVFGPDRPRVRFVAPGTVVTTIKGKDTRPFPDVSFTTTITDTMSVRDGTVRCTTTTRTKGDTRIHTVLFALSLLTAPANGGALAAGFGAQLALIQHGIAAQNAKQGSSGPGCLLAQQVFRRDIALSGGRRLVFDYASAGVENGGLVARFIPRLAATAG
jgi:hypothetical protein